MERIRLKDPGAFGLEFQHRLDHSDDEGYRKYVMSVDDGLADYREKVAADQAKLAKSGHRFWNDEQLQERRDEHADEAWKAIQAMPQVKTLDTRINEIRARLEKRGIPVYNDRRLATIEREIEPISKDVIKIRDRCKTAMARGDIETVDLIMNWPGDGGGHLLRDDTQPAHEALVPVVERWLASRQSPKEQAALQASQVSLGELLNVNETARQALGIVDSDLIMLPMSGGSEPPEAA
jgi:hypothetical protein